MRLYFRACAVVAVLVGVGFLLPAAAQPLRPDPIPGPKAAPPKPQLTVKVFKLERGEPQAVVEALTALLEDPDMEVAPPMPMGGPPVPPLGGMFGIGGNLGGGAGFGGNLGIGGGNVVPVWRATVQERTKAVIVRGSERHIKVAADLVAILDRAANAPVPQLQVVKAFALKHSDAAELMQVIAALEFEDVRLAAPGEKLLAVIAPDDAAKSIAELVKELDVPGKPDPAPKKGERGPGEPQP